MLKGFGAGTAAAFLSLATPAAQGAAQAAPAAALAPQTIDRAQGEEMVKGMFAQVDANHDGVVDAAEQEAARAAEKPKG